jgi:hypothetical protein
VPPVKFSLFTVFSLLILCCAAATRQKHSETGPQIVPSPNHKVKNQLAGPRTMEIKGVLNDTDGKHLTGVIGVLFAVYDQQQGGTPLWQEVQNVDVDKRGDFTILVEKEGIPSELFTTKKLLWLGELVLLAGEVEQPRVPLMSTGHGLMAEETVRLLIPRNSGLEPTVPESQGAWEESLGSSEEQSTANNKTTSSSPEEATEGSRRMSRGRRRFHRP